MVDGQTRYWRLPIDFFRGGNGSIKSLQRDAIVGRWGGHTLNLGGVDRMAAEHRSVVAADRGGREMSEAAAKMNS